MGMEVKLCGIRGSIPSPTTPAEIEDKIHRLLNEFVESGESDTAKFINNHSSGQLGGFGGNTACIEVKSPNSQLIIDGGSGIRQLGMSMLGGPAGRGQGEIHILFTHFHWDHIMGLPFFIPLFIPGNKVHIYSVQKDTEQVLRHVFQKPYFPVPYERLAAEIIYHELEPRQPKEFEEFTVTPYRLDHPDPCWGYKIVHDGRCFSYCVDTECTRVSREDLGEDLPLYQDVDLMLFDAQYTFVESLEKIDWGHASAPIGVDLALREKVKKIVFVHHDPGASDAKVQEAQNQTRAYFEAAVAGLKASKKDVPTTEWQFGREGDIFKL